MDIDKIEVTHNKDENRFEVVIGGFLSKLDYMQNGDSFVITHVGVHPEHRGQGVAGKITQAALEYAKASGYRVVPMCTYAAAYIRRNPQYAELTRSKTSE